MMLPTGNERKGGTSRLSHEPAGRLAQVAVTYRGEPLDDQAKDIVTTIRGMQVEGVQTLVAGPTAQLIDRVASIGDTLPLMALVIAGATFVLLFLAFGSVLITAIVLDALLVRMVVVPATMRLLGDANWWLPGPLARLYGRFGLGEDGGSSTEPSTEDSGSEGAAAPDGPASAPGTRVRPVPAS